MITLDYAYITYPGDRSINEDAVGFVATQENTVSSFVMVLADMVWGMRHLLW